MEKFIGIIGLLVMFGIAFGLCKREDWKYINLRVVIGGTLMQLLFAFLILKTPVSKIFDWANIAVNELLNFTNKEIGRAHV